MLKEELEIIEVKYSQENLLTLISIKSYMKKFLKKLI